MKRNIFLLEVCIYCYANCRFFILFPMCVWLSICTSVRVQDRFEKQKLRRKIFQTPIRVINEFYSHSTFVGFKSTRFILSSGCCRKIFIFPLKKPDFSFTFYPRGNSTSAFNTANLIHNRLSRASRNTELIRNIIFNFKLKHLEQFQSANFIFPIKYLLSRNYFKLKLWLNSSRLCIMNHNFITMVHL